MEGGADAPQPGGGGGGKDAMMAAVDENDLVPLRVHQYVKSRQVTSMKKKVIHVFCDNGIRYECGR